LFSNRERPHLLLLDGGTHPSLAQVLEAVREGLQVERIGTAAGEWLPRLQDSRLGGLVVATDALASRDLAVLGGFLATLPSLEVLLLVGGRGLAGLEEILSLPRVQVLPEPWTPAGLEQILARETLPVAAAPQAPGAGPAGAPQPGPDSGAGPKTLAGVVESLRDPLASLAGYLQLARSENASEEAGRPVDAAIDSAREIETLLEILQLAAGGRRPRPRRLDLREFAADAVRAAARTGRQPRLRFTKEVEIEADPRVLRAGLFTAGLFLNRFGPPGDPVLEGEAGPGGIHLAWSLPAPPPREPESLHPPPGFLLAVLENLAGQLSARVFLKKAQGVVPVEVGLDWPPSAGPGRPG